MRRLVAETSLEPRRLVLPLFVREGAVEARAIPSMPGVVQHTRDTLRKVALESVEAELGTVVIAGRVVAATGFGDRPVPAQFNAAADGDTIDIAIAHHGTLRLPTK